MNVYIFSKVIFARQCHRHLQLKIDDGRRPKAKSMQAKNDSMSKNTRKNYQEQRLFPEMLRPFNILLAFQKPF